MERLGGVHIGRVLVQVHRRLETAVKIVKLQAITRLAHVQIGRDVVALHLLALTVPLDPIRLAAARLRNLLPPVRIERIKGDLVRLGIDRIVAVLPEQLRLVAVGIRRDCVSGPPRRSNAPVVL